MPDRIIRDRSRQSPTLRELSDAAERTWWRLIVAVDDHGRFDAEIEVLLNILFPRRPHGWTTARMGRSLEELVAAGLVVLYRVGIRRYGYLPSWSRHQRPPRLRSKYPDPPNDITVPSERTIHDAIFLELQARRELFGIVILTVDRNVRIGNGFADLVLAVAGGRIVVEVKRTRADAGAIRQVMGYRDQLADPAGAIVIATGLGPTVGPKDFTDAGVALAVYSTNWKAELVVPAKPFMEGILDLRGYVKSHDPTCDLPVDHDCPGDERREARDEKRETRSEKRGNTSRQGGESPAQVSSVWGTPEGLVELYNADTADECPAVTTLTPARRAKAKKYLAAFPEQAFWRQAFAASKTSRFLRGLNNRPGGGHEKFVADFDWYLSIGKNGAENCAKAFEGKYRG